MADERTKLTKHAAGDLEPDEAILAALRGTARGTAAVAVLGGPGAVAVATADTPETEDDAAGVDAGAGLDVAAALTDRRILVWRLGGRRHRPQELLGAISRADVESVELGDGDEYGPRMSEVVVHTKTGGEVGIGVPNVHRLAAEAFVGSCVWIRDEYTDNYNDEYTDGVAQAE